MKPLLILLVLLSALFFAQGCASAQGDLRPELEKAYEAFYSALEAGDAEKFKRSLAAFRYGKMRNQAVSKRERFPESFFQEVKRHDGFGIDLKKLQHLKTVSLGDVAYMMYYSKETEDPTNKDKEPAAVITSLLFVKESGEWKFAEAERGHFRGEEAQTAPSKLAEEAVPTFHESAGALSGKVPAVPPDYRAPDYVGSLVIRAANCKVTVNYNSEVEIVEDFQSVMPLNGGLKRGKNLIAIKVEPMSVKTAEVGRSGTVPEVEVEVSAYSEGGEKVARVFRFATKDFGEVKKEFEVTDEIVAKGTEALRPLK